MFTTKLAVSPGGNGTSTTLEWIGPASELLGSRSFGVRSMFVGSTGGAVDTRRHTLAWFPGAMGFDAEWFDIGDHPRGPSFPAPFPGNAVLAPLIDGGFAVRVGDDWVGTIDSDGKTLEP